jgi:hypothetical protein
MEFGATSVARIYREICNIEFWLSRKNATMPKVISTSEMQQYTRGGEASFPPKRNSGSFEKEGAFSHISFDGKTYFPATRF